MAAACNQLLFSFSLSLFSASNLTPRSSVFLLVFGLSEAVKPTGDPLKELVAAGTVSSATVGSVVSSKV